MARGLKFRIMARGLKFRIKEEEGLYYPCSENKGADQLHGYHEADLRLCFRICKKPVFSRRGSYAKYHLIITEKSSLSVLLIWIFFINELYSNDINTSFSKQCRP